MTKQILYCVIGEGKMPCAAWVGCMKVQADANKQSISVNFNMGEASPEQLEIRLDQLGYEVIPA